MEHISLAALEGITLNIPNAIREIDSAIANTFEDHSPDEVAWTWMYISWATAIYTHYSSLPEAQRISEKDCRAKAKKLAKSVLATVEDAELHPNDLLNPADAAALLPAVKEMTSILQSPSTGQGNNDGAELKRFRSALRAASARVLAMDPKYYEPLHGILSNPMTEGEQRDRAWQRHSTWIRSLYERKPIFTIDQEKQFPLSSVYQRLRAYWHEEVLGDSADDQTDDHRPDGKRKMRLRTHVDHLHGLVHSWLRETTTIPLRIVAGGPGSGKSSFAKAFAVEVSDQTEWRVIFIELQNLEFDKGDLERRIGEHLTSAAVYSAIDPGGTAGFPQNPLAWRADASDPVLLIFDGLDELSASNETSAELSRTFVLAVNNYLVRANANTGIAPIRAIILGRNTACETGVRAANLPLSTVIHVAALKPLTSDSDLGLDILSNQDIDQISDLNAVREIDQRKEYWQRWADLTGLTKKTVPKAVTSNVLKELNVEPLLLHLLIQSGYTGDNWAKAADNRNRVYQEIFNRVLKRNENKKPISGKSLTASDAMVALECLGLAAWRGGGRTGDNDTFRELLERYAPRLYRDYRKDDDLLSQHYIAVQFHTRQGFGDGYEFLHKSFGEYLTARALLSIAQFSARRMLDEEEPEAPKEAARRWCALVASAEMTDFVVKFVSDEARLLAEQKEILPMKDELTKLFSWVQHHGMPVHEGASGTYREIETAQRCAETALLTVVSALGHACRNEYDENAASSTDDVPPWRINVDWPDHSNEVTNSTGPRRMLTRLGNAWEPAVRRSLGGLVLKDTWLSSLWLIDADLSRSNLSGSHLTMTNFARTNLTAADLSRAHINFANLSQANLTEANLTGAQLSETDLTYANLFDADLPFSNLFNADLTEAILTGANLTNADLTDADLTNADLTNANLTNVDLTNANLTNADLTNANLNNADLTNANLTDADLTDADLTNADLTNADLTNADLTNTNLTYLDRSMAMGLE